MLTKARGKVLFIDEAYQLNPRQGGGFMQEVVDELVRCLTSEDFKEKLVVILAGYEQNMNEMLAVNPGLKSRFAERIHFPDFTPEIVQALLLRKATENKLEVDDCAVKYLSAVVSEHLVASHHFGNGRDVNSYFKSVFSAVAMRCAEHPEDEEKVTVQDLYAALVEFLSTRRQQSDCDALAAPPKENHVTVSPLKI